MSDEIDREAVKQAVRAVARDEGQQCPTCRGDGKIPGGRRLIHCRGGFTGADWDEETVLAAIDAAEKVKWMPGAPLVTIWRLGRSTARYGASRSRRRKRVRLLFDKSPTHDWIHSWPTQSSFARPSQ